MGYKALQAMQKKNYNLYHEDYGECIGPKQPTYERKELADMDLRDAVTRFIHDRCENLRYRYNGSADDLEGISGEEQIPYDMQMDIDRICLEKALDRFIESGTTNDAFDVYFCYLEMFIGEYSRVRHMIEMLSEFERNGSSLLMRHRDHYSHSVYVFALGLAIYETNETYREAYKIFYGFKKSEEELAAHHFLQFWGLSSLFHDVGYPFELPFEQACSYFEGQGKSREGIPFMAYQDLGGFVALGKECKEHFKTILGMKPDDNLKDSNDLFAYALAKKMGKDYHFTRESMKVVLDTKPVNPNRFGYFMDHAFFSATILLKELIDELPLEEITADYVDALTAILLHNSLYKFSVAFYKNKDLNRQISPEDHPLAYMLMLCDELQCWDRTSYGRNSRTELHPMGCEFRFENSGIQAKYLYDISQKKKIDRYLEDLEKFKAGLVAKKPKLKAYASMIGENDIESDIKRIVNLENGISLSVTTDLRPLDRSSKKTYLSESSFIHLYYFAVAMHAQYNDNYNTEKLSEEFSQLSLEYKLSNIAQAKEFARHLNEIGCFYTDRPVDFALVEAFTPEELTILGSREHVRWEKEKHGMCWMPAGNMANICKSNRAVREQTRMHYDLNVLFEDLPEHEKAKDISPLNTMMQKLYEFEGVRIYSLEK